MPANENGVCSEPFGVSLETILLDSLAYDVAYGISRENDVGGTYSSTETEIFPYTRTARASLR